MILKNLKQLLRRPMTLLVTSYCLTITYDRVSFTYKSLRNHVQKCCIFLTGGAYAPYTHCMSTPLWPVWAVQAMQCELHSAFQLSVGTLTADCDYHENILYPSELTVGLRLFSPFFHTLSRFALFLSASLYFSKRGAYWDRLCRDVVGRCFDARAL